MEIRNLITFTKVAETQSLSQTAKALGYAQSTVTMQMQQLEQELGTQLYERVGKQIRITQTGQEFLSYASAIVRMSEEALTVGKTDTAAVTGSLRLGISSPLSGRIVSPGIARYLQNHPQVDLEVQTIPNSEELLFKLRHNEVDLAVTLDQRLTDADLIHDGEDQLIPYHFYAAANHPLAGQCNLTLEKIWHYPLIRTVYYKTDSPQPYLADPNLALSIAAFRTPDSSQAAIVPVPDLIAQNHPDFHKLVRLHCEVPVPGLWLQVLYHRNKWLTGAMKAWLSDSQKLTFSL